jgi:hypothetical protein
MTFFDMKLWRNTVSEQNEQEKVSDIDAIHPGFKP